MDLPPIVHEWRCDLTVSSRAVENLLKPIVLKKGEFGRGRDLPALRLAEIDAACNTHGITRHQALSFRRQLLRSRPGGMRRVGQSSAMGNAQGQQKAANLFEDAVGHYLRNGIGLNVLDERQQRDVARAEERRVVCTPDFKWAIGEDQ